MSRLDWCRKRENGIRIVEPNENLAEKYMDKSDDSLKMIE